MNRTDKTKHLVGIAVALAGTAWGVELVDTGHPLAVLPATITLAIAIRLADNLHAAGRLARHRRRVVAARAWLAAGARRNREDAAKFAAIVRAEYDKEV